MKGLACGDRALSASVSYPAKARRYRPLGPSPAGQAHGLKIDAVGTGEESQFVHSTAIPRSAFGVVVW